MRLLYYSMHANNDPVFMDWLRKRGHTLAVVDRECRDYTRDASLAALLMGVINENKLEGVFSFNYFPIISMVCDVCRIPYFSWVYDSPHKTLQSKCTSLGCNHIGVFDSALARSLEHTGRVSYVPLGADGDFFEEAAKKCRRDLTCDVSFLGSLYTGNYSYYTRFREDGPVWELLDKVINAQAFDYEADHLEAVLEDEDLFGYLYSLMEREGLVLNEDYYEDRRGLVRDSILRKQVTVVERSSLLGAAAAFCREKGYRFALYTTPGQPLPEELRSGENTFGPLDYLTEMSSLFVSSRINLNITLRSIERGIPLRAVDILASGGFLLTDPRPDLAEILVEGEDYAVYHSREDCLEKIGYFLSHEEERADMARRGREKARKYLSYERGAKALGL